MGIAFLAIGAVGIAFGILSVAAGIACGASGYGAPAAPALLAVGSVIVVGGAVMIFIGTLNLAESRKLKNHLKYNEEGPDQLKVVGMNGELKVDSPIKSKL